MDLSVITVTHNAAGEIERQIKSVSNGCKNISYEQLVSDNASTDSTVAVIEKNFPQIKLIKNNSNTGFGFANNEAAKLSTGDFLLFLNPDTKVEEGSLGKMVAWMREHPHVGIASCKLVDESGNIMADAKPRRFPGVFDQICVLLKLPHLFPVVIGRYLYAGVDFNQEQEVDSVRGAFMMMRRELYLKLGWAFDPRYYIWFEDVDTCREAKRFGYKVVHTPIISCVDYVGQTFKKQNPYWKQKIFTKSMLGYFQKWEPWHKWIWIAIFRPVAISLTWIFGILA